MKFPIQNSSPALLSTTSPAINNFSPPPIQFLTRNSYELTRTTMAASNTMLSINFSLCPFNQTLKSSRCTVNFLPFTKKISLNLTSFHSISGFAPLPRHSVFTVASPTQNPQPLTIVSAKGYKMKTHKASAKRFRVTGSGKIMRRRAGKQHLLAKKNTKRKLRLSKMVQVNRSDYDNVIGALPYLKVNLRK